MREDGLESPDLNGRWVGFYRYRSELSDSFPITAEILHEGGRFTGEMHDQIIDHTGFLETIIEKRKGDIPLSQKLWLERIIRHYGTKAIFVTEQLPATSSLKGWVKGTRVEFTKTYCGKSVSTWAIQDKRPVSRSVRNHSVHYAGILDMERGNISGIWTIWRRGLLGRILPHLARGAFELYRKAT